MSIESKKVKIHICVSPDINGERCKSKPHSSSPFCAEHYFYHEKYIEFKRIEKPLERVIKRQDEDIDDLIRSYKFIDGAYQKRCKFREEAFCHESWDDAYDVKIKYLWNILENITDNMNKNYHNIDPSRNDEIYKFMSEKRKSRLEEENKWWNYLPTNVYEAIQNTAQSFARTYEFESYMQEKYNLVRLHDLHYFYIFLDRFMDKLYQESRYLIVSKTYEQTFDKGALYSQWLQCKECYHTLYVSLTSGTKESELLYRKMHLILTKLRNRTSSNSRKDPDEKSYTIRVFRCSPRLYKIWFVDIEEYVCGFISEKGIDICMETEEFVYNDTIHKYWRYVPMFEDLNKLQIFYDSQKQMNIVIKNGEFSIIISDGTIEKKMKYDVLNMNSFDIHMFQHTSLYQNIVSNIS